MITELACIAYFENLAGQHRLIAHGQDGRNAFFYVPAEYDLREIDNCLRSGVSTPLLMLDCSDGTLNDNGSASHHQDINVQFTILDKVDSGEVASIRDARDQCLAVGAQILERMLTDKREKQLLVHGKSVQFNISQVKYDPVGPMQANYYGYTFRCTLRCPFGFNVDGGTWRDIPAT